MNDSYNVTYVPGVNRTSTRDKKLFKIYLIYIKTVVYLYKQTKSYKKNFILENNERKTRTNFSLCLTPPLHQSVVNKRISYNTNIKP